MLGEFREQRAERRVESRPGYPAHPYKERIKNTSRERQIIEELLSEVSEGK